MNISTKPNFKSFDQLNKKLDVLNKKIERQAKRQTLSRAATPIVKEAKRTASNRFGHLKKSIQSKVKTYKKGGQVIAIVGARKEYQVTDDMGKKIRPAKYFHLIEYGTKKIKANPFLRNAFEKTKSISLRIYETEIKNTINKVVLNLKNKRIL